MRSSGSRVGWKMLFVILTKLIPRKNFFLYCKTFGVDGTLSHPPYTSVFPPRPLTPFHSPVLARPRPFLARPSKRAKREIYYFICRSLRNDNKFLDSKICTFKILLSWRFPRKTALWTIFLSAPHPQPPSKPQILFLLSSRRLWICRVSQFRSHFFSASKTLRAQRLTKIQDRLKFSISLENFKVAWNFQSWPPEFPTKNRGLVGLEKVQGATRLGATGLRDSERKSASERVSERTSEKPLKNLWKTSQKSLKTSQKSLKTSQNLSKPLKTSEILWKTSRKSLKNLWKPPSQRPSQRPLSEADFLSEALSPVAPILLPLDLSPMGGSLENFKLALKFQDLEFFSRLGP